MPFRLLPFVLRRAAAALGLALAVALPAAAFDPAAMTDADRAAFRAEVRAYLLENPEVLLEAIAILEERESASQAVDDATLIAVNAEAIFEDGHSWATGNPEGDVTIVEFADYNCGFCRRAYHDVMDLLEDDGNLRFVVKEFPILGPASELAARFAVATLQLEGAAAYGDLHDRLMTQRGQVDAGVLQRVGIELALDVEAISAHMDSPDVTAVLEENRALAGRLGIGGTPTFVIGDRMERGYRTAEQMAEIVQALRAD